MTRIRKNNKWVLIVVCILTFYSGIKLEGGRAPEEALPRALCSAGVRKNESVALHTFLM